VDISENFDGGLELDKWFFLFKYFLHFFNQEFNHFNWKVDEWHRLWILLPIENNVVIKVVNHDVYNEIDFILHIFFGNRRHALLEIETPLFLHVQSFRLVLLWLQVLVE
jgi:hypothetical protein